MKILFGGGIVAARGSIAGNTFSRNHYGAYVRARVKPVNPNTARQQQVRNSIAFLAAYWAGTLTALQRTAWDLYGSSVAMTDSLGATMYLTGYNHFIRSNIALKVAAKTIVADGPVIFEIPAKDPTFAITASEAVQEISHVFDNSMAWANEDGGFMFLYQGKPQNPQRNSFFGPWRWMGFATGNDITPPVSPIDLAVDFAISEGQRQWGYARIIRADGRLSEPFRADTFCTA